MIKKEIVTQIKQELVLTANSIPEIAKKYNVSRASVNNINIGKSHKEDILYPLRQPANYFFSDNEVAFIRHLSVEGYSAKQIHIIMCRGSYSTISNILGEKTRSNLGDYEPVDYLEERREIFDFIAAPKTEFINPFTDNITVDDAIYIKLLGRFMAPLLDTIEAFLPIIESNMVGYTYPLETREDIAAYLEWGGTAFPTIWWIKGIFNNKINRIGDIAVHYDQFPIERFLEVEPNINLDIIKEMINFETKENYKKS